MSTLTTLELFREDMHFSAGHFTIFSPTKREPLHGHSFYVKVNITAEISNNGMMVDYGIYKKQIRELCQSLGQIFLLPGESPHLAIHDEGDYYWVHFNGEKIPFLKTDVKILPIRNITVEELSAWFIAQLTKDAEQVAAHKIHQLTVKVFSGPGQGAGLTWDNPNK